MTELTDLSPTDASNTAISGQSLEGNVANMGAMDDTLQAMLGMLGRWTSSDTIASATTTDIGAQPEAYLTVSGTTTITGFGTVRTGTIRFLRFSGALTLTHNATSLILPGAANITTAAGDTAVFVSEGSGNWRCLGYQRNSQSPASIAATVETRRNRVVNGDMRVSQEHGTASGTTNGRYPVDQWAQFFVTSAGTLTVEQAASVTPAGSPNRLRATVTVADATLAAGEYWVLTQNLEGSNVADFQYGGSAAKAAVLRFGFKGPAGTYAARVSNAAANRSFVALFTITAGQANTDTVQTIAIPGDTSGTWLTADGVIGMTLGIVLACGSTFQGVAGWQAGLILGTSGVSNGMATGGAVFELFDVGLKLDPDATGVYGAYEIGPVDAVYRSERYLPVFTSSARMQIGVAQAIAVDSARLVLPLGIRTCKPVTGSSGSGSIRGLTAGGGSLLSFSVLTVNSDTSTFAIAIDLTSGSGLAAGNASMIYLDAGGKLVFTGARLS